MALNTKHEKYRDALTKAALGEISGRRLAELLAHTAECEACREEYARARQLREMVDRGVSGAVAGEPSAGFEARLRARLADAPAPARWRAAWVPAGVAACAVAAVVMIFVVRGPKRNSPRGDVGVVQTAVAINPGKTAGTAFLRRCGSGQGCAPTAVEAKSAVAMVGRPRRAAKRVAQRHSEPEVIVPPGQMEALAQFAEAIEKKEIDPKQFQAERDALQQPILISPINIKPIEIKAIEIPPVDVNKPRAMADVPPTGPAPEAGFLPVGP